MRGALIIVLVVLCGSAQAANLYVRDGGSSSSCTGWATANACDQVTTALGVVGRGDTIYVADGTYNSITLDKANSGTTYITIKKATAASHGTDTDWVSTYGDGQATITSALFGSDYWVVDGATRNESNWSDGNSYGFRIQSFTANTSITSGVCASNLTVQYINAGGTPTGDPPTGGLDQVFYIGGFAEYCQNWTLSRNYVHDSKTTYHINGSTGTNFLEYSYMINGWSKEAFRGQIFAAGWTIRHNIWKDSCQGDYTSPDGSACTGIIAMFDGYENSSGWANTKIYGNVFLATNNASMQDAIIVVGGSSDVVSGVEVHNNTFAGFEQGNRTLLVRGANDVCRNNLAWDVTGGMSFSCSTVSNNTNAGSNPFVNYAGGDFHLSGATAAGTTLSSPYDVDMDGVTRGIDGTWDIGAYEFDSGSPPSAPSNFRLASWAGWLLILGLASSLMGRMRHGKDGDIGGAGAARRRFGRMGRAQSVRVAG